MLGVSEDFILDRSFLKGESQGPIEGNAIHTVEVEASQNPPSKEAVPLMSGLLLIALDAKQVADVSSVVVSETSLNTLLDDAAPQR